MNPYGEAAPLVDLAIFPEWILQEDENLLIINKPGWLVCHPSKNGPLSSLVGVVREHTGAEKLHLVARLDRETSGLIVFAKRPSVARKFQMAIQSRIVKKEYLAILQGEFDGPIHVDEPIARRRGGPVIVKSEVSYDRTSQTAVTDFIPLISKNGYTLCRVELETGRKHQIRVHAEFLEKRLVGDKFTDPMRPCISSLSRMAGPIGWKRLCRSSVKLCIVIATCLTFRRDRSHLPHRYRKTCLNSANSIWG